MLPIYTNMLLSQGGEGTVCVPLPVVWAYLIDMSSTYMYLTGGG